MLLQFAAMKEWNVGPFIHPFNMSGPTVGQTWCWVLKMLRQYARPDLGFMIKGWRNSHDKRPML